MRGSRVLIVVLASILFPAMAPAGDLSPDDKAFLDKNISSIVRIDYTLMDDPAITKVFGAHFFRVKIIIKEELGEQTQELVVMRAGEKLANVSAPGSDGDLPELVKMFKAGFALKTDADAKLLQQALDILYPPFTDEDKKLVAFVHAGNQWTFVRGKFFDGKKGYVFTTDAAGAITRAKFVLKMP